MAAKDILMIGVLIFVFGLGFMVISYVGSTVVDSMTTNPIINQSNNTITVFESINTITGRFDYIVFGLFIGLTLGLIATGYLFGGNRILMFFYFVVVTIGVVVSTVLSNVWESFSTTSHFTATLAAFPITNNLLLNLPYYIAIIGFIGLIVMFAKPFLGGGGGGEF